MDITLIKKFHESSYKFFISITGGGQSFIGDFCSVSGASKNLIGAFVPYNQKIFDDFIGQSLQKYSTTEAARKLALTSYQKCILAGIDPQYAVGIGSANSIAYEGERIGREHKINISVHTLNSTIVTEIVLDQSRSRGCEENYIKDLIYHEINFLLTNIYPTFLNKINSNNYGLIYFKDSEKFSRNVYSSPLANHVLSYKSPYIIKHYDNEIHNNDNLNVYPGSFRPLHDGHRSIYEISERVLNGNVHFELTLNPADKGSLDYFDVCERLKQFDDNKLSYVLTKAKTIKEKVLALKQNRPDLKITFIMGMDTWVRIWDPKYGYPLKELEQFFIENNVKFLVFGRNELTLDKTYGSMLLVESEEASNFKMNISSTQIRNQQKI